MLDAELQEGISVGKVSVVFGIVTMFTMAVLALLLPLPLKITLLSWSAIWGVLYIAVHKKVVRYIYEEATQAIIHLINVRTGSDQNQ